jgi:hypothetical protein
MTASQIAQQVKETQSAVQFRFRKNPAGKTLILRDESGNVQYDVKDLFNGKTRGWQVFDMFTAGAFCTVYNALSEENKPKFDRLQMATLTDFVWSSVK